MFLQEKQREMIVLKKGDVIHMQGQRKLQHFIV
jgi:hypothetical protein